MSINISVTSRPMSFTIAGIFTKQHEMNIVFQKQQDPILLRNGNEDDNSHK
jgi:hypothetical protein